MRVSVKELLRNPIEFNWVRNLFETDKYEDSPQCAN